MKSEMGSSKGTATRAAAGAAGWTDGARGGTATQIESRMARRMAQARHPKGDERESSGSANGRQREGGKKRRGKHREKSKTRDRKEVTGNGRRPGGELGPSHRHKASHKG